MAQRTRTFLMPLVIFVTGATLAAVATLFPLAQHASAETANGPYGKRPGMIDLSNTYHPPMVYVASDVTVEQKRQTVSGTFDVLNNEADIVGDLQYRVEIFGDMKGHEGSGDPELLLSQSDAVDLPSLLPSEKKHISYSYTIPSLPSGAYAVQIQILHAKGRELGWGRGTFSVADGSQSFAHLYSANIVLPEYQNKVVQGGTGPNVNGGSTFTIQANAMNVTDKPLTAHAVLDLYPFDQSRGKIGQITFDDITLQPGETKTISYPVTAAQTAGVYVGQMTLQTNDGKVVSSLGTYRWVVRGVSADVLSARIASLSTTKNSSTLARIEYVGSADAETQATGMMNVELTDAQGTLASVTVPSIRLTDGVGVEMIKLTLTRDLVGSPSLRVTISDDNGKSLVSSVSKNSLTPTQIVSAASTSNWTLWLRWYTNYQYLLFAAVLLAFAYSAWRIIRAAVTHGVLLDKPFQVVTASFVILSILFMSSPLAVAAGGNGIEVFTAITPHNNAIFLNDVPAQFQTWGPVWDTPFVSLFVNAPIHDAPAGTYQCNGSIPLQYRVDYAACKNTPVAMHVIGRFDANANKQSTLFGTSANWVNVHDNVFTDQTTCVGNSCIASNTFNGSVTLSGLPANATATTLQVVAKFNPFVDANHGIPNNVIDQSDIYFQRSFATAVNLWINCALPQADVTIQKSGPPSFNQGNSVSYSIVATNNGPATAQNVVVTDAVPTGLSYLPASSDNRCTLQGSNVVCNLGSMTSAQQIPLTLAFQSSAQTACGPLNNTATIATSTQESNTGNNSASFQTQVQCVVQNGCIDILKQAFNPVGGALFVVPQFAFSIDGSPAGLNDSNGNLHIANVTPGNHTITEAIPNGWSQLQVLPANGVVTVASGNACAAVNFKNQQNAISSSSSSVPQNGCITITKQAFNPTGTQLSVVPQFSFSIDGSPAGMNDSNGNLQVSNITPGTHTVTETVPSGWSQLQIAPANGVVTVTSGNSCVGVNFKNQQNALSSSSSSSSSSVPQTGCVDILKEVFNPFGTQLSTVPPFSFSIDGVAAGANDSTGHLHIGNIVAGSHTITETVPSGWSQILVTPVNGVVNVQSGNACVGMTFKNQQNALSSSSSSSQASITDVSITKTANPVTVTQGSVTQFTVTVTNNGPSVAQAVTVNDPLPSGLTFSSVTTTVGSYSGNIWTIGTMNVGQSVTMQLSASVNVAGSVTNVATVSTSTQESNYGNNVASATVSTTQVQQNGCLDVYKTAVDSNGNGIGNVPSFTFSLDGNQTQSNDSSGHAHFSNVSIGTHTITEYQQTGWNMVSMNPAGGTVNVTSGNCVAVYVRNQQNSNNNVVSLQVTKDDGRSQVQPGDSLTYTIVVRNQNGTNVNNVTATDTVPAGETAVSASNGGFVNSQYVTWNNLSIPAYGTLTLTMTATVNQNANGSLTNQVNVGGAVAFDTDTVQATSSSLTLSKSASTSEVFPGGMIEYTVKIQNTGNGSLQNIRVVDSLPGNVSIVDAGGGNANGSSSITWNVGTLNGNETRTFNYRISLSGFYQPGQLVINNVEATANNGIDQHASTTVQVIGNLPQTGWMNDLGGPSPFLHPINAMVKQATGRGSSSAGLPLTIWVSLAGLATGAIGGFGKRFLTGM